MRPSASNILTFVKLPSSKLGSRDSKLHSVRCVMGPASLRSSPQFVRKAERLHAAAPDIAAIVETLLDDLLMEVS